MKKKILVVEDDQFFRETVCELLQKKFDVKEAASGKAAIEILSIADFDLVLSDIQMPGMTGIELLEWSQKNKPIPFVIMTGFSLLLETKTAFDLGAKGFVSKPFKSSELLATIDSIIGDKEKIEVAEVQPKQDYCKVSIDEFVARPKIDFDVFIKLSETKVIRLAHKGEQLPADRVQHYKEKGVKFLHILKEDFGKLVDFNMSLTRIIKDRDDISIEKKMNFIKYTGEVLMEKVFVMGLDKQSFTDGQNFLNMSLGVISDSKEHLDLLDALNANSDQVYAHSLGVALYSVMVAKKMGFEANSVLFKIMMAGLYHDIGKKEIDRALLEKPRQLLSQQERKIFETHVIRSQEILMQVHGVSEEVAQIVSEHHEDMTGNGYPLNKAVKFQHPLSRIIQAVNIFMELVVKPGNEHVTGPAAVAQIEKVYDNRVDKKVLAALKSIFSA
ncbi:MAG: response regulator [Bdellovibrio sp.]|nr:response regulator [Bdellovibrio sp.]